MDAEKVGKSEIRLPGKLGSFGDIPNGWCVPRYSFIEVESHLPNVGKAVGGMLGPPGKRNSAE